MAEQHMDEEQMKALQEKIKNMSPEELKEFQKKQCIFCQIIAGKVPSKKVYEDSDALAILDINPASLGHILLLPKEHYSILPQISDELIRHIFMAAKTLSNAMLRGLEAQGVNILVANGVAAGQKAQHFMVHLIARMEGDDLAFDIPQNGHSEKELMEAAQKIASGFGHSARLPARGEPAMTEAAPEPVEIVSPKGTKPAAREEAKPKPKKLPPKKEQTRQEQEPRKEEPSEDKKDKTRIDLDDIARMLGVK